MWFPPPVKDTGKECWEYYPRRPFADQNFVSIEMGYGFDALVPGEIRDTMNMFVLAEMFNNQKSADSVVRILKPKFKTARTKEQAIYLGCIHWEILKAINASPFIIRNAVENNNGREYLKLNQKSTRIAQ